MPSVRQIDRSTRTKKLTYHQRMAVPLPLDIPDAGIGMKWEYCFFGDANGNGYYQWAEVGDPVEQAVLNMIAREYGQGEVIYGERNHGFWGEPQIVQALQSVLPGTKGKKGGNLVTVSTGLFSGAQHPPVNKAAKVSPVRYSYPITINTSPGLTDISNPSSSPFPSVKMGDHQQGHLAPYESVNSQPMSHDIGFLAQQITTSIATPQRHNSLPTIHPINTSSHSSSHPSAQDVFYQYTNSDIPSSPPSRKRKSEPDSAEWKKPKTTPSKALPPHHETTYQTCNTPLSSSSNSSISSSSSSGSKSYLEYVKSLGESIDFKIERAIKTPRRISPKGIGSSGSPSSSRDLVTPSKPATTRTSGEIKNGRISSTSNPTSKQHEANVTLSSEDKQKLQPSPPESMYKYTETNDNPFYLPTPSPTCSTSTQNTAQTPPQVVTTLTKRLLSLEREQPVFEQNQNLETNTGYTASTLFPLSVDSAIIPPTPPLSINNEDEIEISEIDRIWNECLKPVATDEENCCYLQLDNVGQGSLFVSGFEGCSLNNRR